MYLPNETEIEHRKPVWTALSDLWLDTELDESDLSYIVREMHDSGYSIEELREIYLYEVAPAVYWNLLIVAGEWGFEDAWLHDRILRLLRRRTRLGRWWIRALRRRMTYATEEHWVDLQRRVEARRASVPCPPSGFALGNR
jgi:hypothetical protein